MDRNRIKLVSISCRFRYLYLCPGNVNEAREFLPCRLRTTEENIQLGYIFEFAVPETFDILQRVHFENFFCNVQSLLFGLGMGRESFVSTTEYAWWVPACV